MEHVPKFKVIRESKAIAAKRKSAGSVGASSANEMEETDEPVKEERPLGQKAAKKNRIDDSKRDALRERMIAAEENESRVVATMLQTVADQALFMKRREDIDPEMWPWFDQQRRRALERLDKATAAAEAKEAKGQAEGDQTESEVEVEKENAVA